MNQQKNCCVTPQERSDIIQDLQMTLERGLHAGMDKKDYLSQKSRISYLYRVPSERVNALSAEIKRRIESIIIQVMFLN